MMTFKEDYHGAKMVVLTKNYRSTQSILDASYRLIQNNNPDTLEVTLGISKNLKSIKGRGAQPEFIYTDRVENEADAVTEKIIELVKSEKREFKDFAVLVRANNHADPFVKAFTRSGIPHQFLGPAKLFQQTEIKEIVSFLKILYSQDDTSAFYKLLSCDLFAVDPEVISRIATEARKFNISLYDAAKSSPDIQVKKLVLLVTKYLKVVPKESAGQIVYNFLHETGLFKMMLSPKDNEEIKRTFNLSKFLEKLKSFETNHDDASVYAVVDWIDLLSDVGESPLAADVDWQAENAVNILTIHSSKGLEFPVVFVVNLVGQRFPSTGRREQIPIPDELIKEKLPLGDYHLQEERRLFYVAITRAKDRLFVTASDFYSDAKREKKLSPFIVEALGENKEQRAKSKEQRTKGKEQRVKNKEQKTKNKEQRAKGRDTYELNSNNIVIEKSQSPASVISHPITYLSYSQLETFRFCPLHYKLRYILNISTPPTASLSFGSTLHLVMKDFNSISLQQVVTSKDQVEKLMIGLLEKHWINAGYSSKKHEQEMKKRGEVYLKNYLKSDLYDIKKPPKLLEQKFSFPLDGCKIRGVMDRVDVKGDLIEIIDYKTTDLMNKDIPTEREMKKNLQLSLYALAATRPIHELFGKDPGEIIMSLYFFDLGIKVSTTRTKEDLIDAEQEIIKVKKEIETSDFTCSNNFFCQDCEFKIFCQKDD